MNRQTKILLVVFAGLLVVLYLYNRGSESEHFTNKSSREDGATSLPKNIDEVVNPRDDVKSVDSASTLGTQDTQELQGKDTQSTDSKVPITREEMIKYFPQKDYTTPESDWLQKKFSSRNKAKPGEYKRASYSGSRRGQMGPADWDAYFDHNNNIIGNSQTGDNDKFLPYDETNGGLAVFKSKGRATCGSNQNCEPEELFDVDKYLPQEVNDDWFEVQPEPISVKNRHLINITKPIGINTIGTSLKNASYDLRGAPSCPKFVTSPWLNSSIEPDTNLKPLY